MFSDPNSDLVDRELGRTSGVWEASSDKQNLRSYAVLHLNPKKVHFGVELRLMSHRQWTIPGIEQVPYVFQIFCVSFSYVVSLDATGLPRRLP